MAGRIDENKPFKYKYVHEGENQRDVSLLARCNLTKVPALEMEQPEEQNRILITKEVISAVLEFTEGKMLIHVVPRDLLVIHDWVVV